MTDSLARAVRTIARLVVPRTWLHMVRLANYYGYSHVLPLRRATVGHGAAIAPTVSLRYGENIRLGRNVRLGERTSLWASENGQITLDDDVLLGPDVYITTSNYDFDAHEPVHDAPKKEGNVFIGRDCWLGTKVIVLPGVTIGAGSVVAAGSIVTRDIPPRSLVAGNPARFVRARGDVGPGRHAL